MFAEVRKMFLNARPAEQDVRERQHRTLGSNRLPPHAGRETSADNSANQGAFWWVKDKSESPQPADVGVTGLYVL